MIQHLIHKPNTYGNIIVTEVEIEHMRNHGTQFEDLGVVCQHPCSKSCPFYASGSCPCTPHLSLYKTIVHTFAPGTNFPARFVEV